MKNYSDFIKKLDSELESYFKLQAKDIVCKKGCSDCCKKGDYPLTEPELHYVMQGYSELDNEIKLEIQKNIKTMEKGGACPFLINDLCSIYSYRPIICRVHGLAYLIKNQKVKVPHCAEEGKNFHKVFKDGEIEIAPINKNLDTPSILEGVEYGEMRDLYDWIKPNQQI